MSLKPGDVVLVDLGPVPSGHEQAGIRPAIFVSEEGGVCLLVPLSSNAVRLYFKGTVRIDPNSRNKLAKASVALVFQLRAVDVRRVIKQIGSLSPKEKIAVNKIMRSLTHLQ
jgi:mRNA interferase MazF